MSPSSSSFALLLAVVVALSTAKVASSVVPPLAFVPISPAADGADTDVSCARRSSKYVVSASFQQHPFGQTFNSIDRPKKKNASRLYVQLPTNEKERALDELMTQIAIQNGEDPQEVVAQQRLLQKQQQQATTGGDMVTTEEDWKVLQPTILLAGGMSLLITAAIGAYLVGSGLVLAGTGAAPAV